MVATNDMQHQNTLVAADKEFKSCEIAPNTINGEHKYDFQFKEGTS